MRSRRDGIKRVSIRDVAAAAGVSPTTTSFVLNGQDASISQETRERVRAVAQRLGYRPHASARALATGRTQRLGVVVNTPYSLTGRGTYHTELLAGIMSAAPKINYNLLIHSANYPGWQALYDDIMSGMADGVLLIGREAPDPLTQGLLNARFPTVCVSYNVTPELSGPVGLNPGVTNPELLNPELLNPDEDHPDCYAVDCDNELGGYLAVRHLLAMGHRRILVLARSEGNSWEQERNIGAQRAMQEADLAREQLTFWLPPNPDLTLGEWGAAVVNYLNAAEPRYSAIFCYDENGAQWLAEELPGFGYQVPGDLALISFNSTSISERSRPPLTSVWQPLADIGAAAVEMLAAYIEGRDIPTRILRFPVRLDIRHSCGAHGKGLAS